MTRLDLRVVVCCGWLAVAAAAEAGAGRESGAGLPYRRHRIVVDGSLAEWRGRALTVALADPELAAPQGNHVVARLVWDLEGLYVVFEVSDAEVFTPPVTADPAELFCGDSVELYVDADGNAGEVMGGRDFQFLVACDGRAAVLHGDPLLSRVGFRVPKRLHESAVFQHVAVRTPSGFAVEIGIPWATLGVEVATAGHGLGIDLAFNDWVRPPPLVAGGVDETEKLGAYRRLAGSPGGERPAAAGTAPGDEDPTTADGYWAWSWSGGRDFGYPATWVRVPLVGGPSLAERLDRRLGALRVPAATLAGAGLFTLLAAVVIRVRERRRSRTLLRRIADLEAATAAAAAVAPTAAVPDPGSETGSSGRSELSGRIDLVRRLVHDHEPVHGDLTTRAVACIYERLDDGFTPSELAGRLHVSLRTLQRAVSGTLACSPSELIMAVRLREAYRMLRDEHRSVKDAAISAGFTSQPHFSRKFKLYFGLNPSEVLAGKVAPGRRPYGAD